MRGQQAQKAFTLLELMLTLVIIGVIVGIAVIAWPTHDPHNYLDTQSERIFVHLQDFKARVMLGGGIGIVEIADDGYTFYRVDNLQLKPAQVIQLPEGIQMTLTYQTNTALASINPQFGQRSLIVFFESGEQVPFTLTMTDASQYQTNVTAGNYGELRLSLVNETEL